MRRPLAVLAALATLGLASPAPGEDVPYLEFARELRGRYPDLALEYLNNLRQSNPPADVAAVIPLELAKVRLDLATGEADGGRRLDLYTKARAEFQEFIDKNPNSPLVGDARVEVARVTALQGKTLLSRALMQDDPAARLADALPARQKFIEAGAQLKAVADMLDQQLQKLADAKTPQAQADRKAVEQARFQAQMDFGLNLVDQAETYVDEKRNEVLLERSKVIAQAQPVLDRVAKEAEASFPVITWQARAWAAYCDFQNGDGKKALRRLDEVAARPEPAAAPGKRTALYLRMRILADPPAQPSADDVAQVRKDAETWLADYPRFRDTPEGCAARYYLADMLRRQAEDLKERSARLQQLTRAENLCRDLMRSENEYAERARELSIHIAGAQGGFNKEIAKLDSFEACFIRAQYEAAQIDEFARKKDVKPEDVEKERKTRLGNAITALRLALDIAKRPGAKVPPAELTRARTALCGYYLFTSRYLEAIAVGEEAARAVPPTSQSARAAMYVLEAYSNHINESLRDGSATLADLSQREADGKPSFVERMTDLALVMEQRWPSEQAGNLARHLRGLLLIEQKKQAEAIAVLSQVTPDYSAAVYVKSALAKAAFQAAQDRGAQAKAEPDRARKDQLAKEEGQFEKQAIDALKTMPPLPPGADAQTTGIYLNSRMELARAYYRNKDFTEIDKVVEPLLAGLKQGQFRLDTPDRLKEAESSLVILHLFGRYGSANVEFNAGHAGKVKEILDPVVEAIRKGEYADALKANPDLRWGLMGLALRASIHEGNTARALQTLQAVQKFAAADAGEGGNKAILLQLALMVKEQVRDLRRQKNEQALNEAVKNYGKFLDELRKGQPNPTPDFLRVMAEAYAALGLHDTAVELARQVPEPKGEDAKDEKRVGTYQFCRILIVRELRLAGKIKEAEVELDEVRKSPWGKDHPEAAKEQIHLIAAKGEPTKAYLQWSALLKQLNNRFQQPGMKAQYFECYYYMTECWLKHALALNDPKKKEDGIKRAAGFITKLEANWPDLGGDESKARFTDLLEREPLLKDQYDKLKSDK
jgi:hypothetical protein